MLGQGFLQLLAFRETDALMPEFAKSRAAVKSGKQDFRKILDEVSGRKNVFEGAVKASARRMDPYRDIENVQADNKEIRTFKKAVSIVKAENKGAKSVTGESWQKFAEPVDDKEKLKADAVEEGLAQVLGMDRVVLEGLLEFLGIKPEELANEAQASETAGKLAELVGLTAEGERTFAEIIRTVSRVISEYVDDAVKGETTTVLSGKQLELNAPDESSGILSESVNINGTSGLEDFEGVIDQIRRNVQAVLSKVRSEPQKSFEEITVQIKEMMAKRDMVKVESAPEGLAVEQGVINDKGEASAGKTSMEDNKRGSEPKVEVETGRHAFKAEQPDLQAVDGFTVDDGAVLNTFSVSQPQPLPGYINETAMVRESGYIPQEEVISQIIDKVKVILTEDKSEMILHLKPESLGKLSLKIVTENGIIMAKFVAENQQVKEILESNMQMLKDALAEQGLEIRDFSVTVGHGMADGFQRRQIFEKATDSGLKAGSSVSANTAYTALAEETASKILTYGWSDRYIDLTA